MGTTQLSEPKVSRHCQMTRGSKTASLKTTAFCFFFFDKNKPDNFYFFSSSKTTPNFLFLAGSIYNILTKENYTGKSQTAYGSRVAKSMGFTAARVGSKIFNTALY